MLPSSVAENQPPNTVVGALTATDPDTGNSHTFALVAGAGDADNGSFNIAGTPVAHKRGRSTSRPTRPTRSGSRPPTRAASSSSVASTVTDHRRQRRPHRRQRHLSAGPGGISIGAARRARQRHRPGRHHRPHRHPHHRTRPRQRHRRVLSLNPDGGFQYTPETGYAGATDSFTYQAIDPTTATSNTATVTLNLNQPPLAVNDTATTTEDNPVNINVSANDTDAETPNPGLTVAPGSIAAVTGGTAILQPDNRTVQFTPTANLDDAVGLLHLQGQRRDHDIDHHRDGHHHRHRRQRRPVLRRHEGGARPTPSRTPPQRW